MEIKINVHTYRSVLWLVVALVALGGLYINSLTLVAPPPAPCVQVEPVAPTATAPTFKGQGG